MADTMERRALPCVQTHTSPFLSWRSGVGCAPTGTLWACSLEHGRHAPRHLPGRRCHSCGARSRFGKASGDKHAHVQADTRGLCRHRRQPGTAAPARCEAGSHGSAWCLDEMRLQRRSKPPGRSRSWSRPAPGVYEAGQTPTDSRRDGAGRQTQQRQELRHRPDPARPRPHSCALRDPGAVQQNASAELNGKPCLLQPGALLYNKYNVTCKIKPLFMNVNTLRIFYCPMFQRRN